MDRVECVVVGAGVIGLAVARALALAGREVIVAEAEGLIGSITSSRNSEVIHAGIYYPAGSLKARLCVAGRDMLYAYCEEHGVPYRRSGKLIVASTPEQVQRLAGIRARAESNGVRDLLDLDRHRTLELEPALDVAAALMSPSTGIVDSHAFMLSLQGDAEAAGAAFAFRTPVSSGRIETDGVVLEFGGDEPFALRARHVVNAAGLSAHAVSAAIEGVPAATIPTVAYAKGNYFGFDGRCPFSRLIYPLPEPGGLGVHLTLDMAGRARFGPDVEWVDHLDYAVDPARAEPFYAAIRSYWPGLPDGALYPDYAGIRVKINAAAAPDFRIDRPCGDRLVNLYGFESPGLTASLAIGAEVEALLSP